MLAALLFTAFLLGIPASIGAYIVAKDVGRRDASHGAFMVFYACALGATLGYMLPEGKLLVAAQYQYKAPSVLAVSLLGGAIVGLRRRRRND